MSTPLCSGRFAAVAALLGATTGLTLSAAPQVIIKADDLRYVASSTVDARWQRFADLIEQRHLRAAIGIITESLEASGPDYHEWIRVRHERGAIEFWHHGHGHSRDPATSPAWWEYRNSGYAAQKESFERGMTLAREKLGIIFRTFGAPYNQTDADTVRVLEENPDLRVWLYPSSTAGSTKLALARIGALNIEPATGVIDAEPFIANYPAHAGEPVLVLQCHPGQWDEASHAEFIRILDYLTDQGAVFVTPTEYYNQLYPAGQYRYDLSMPTELGGRYRWERSFDLRNWERWGSPFTGNGQAMATSAVFYGETQAFFRRETLPADAPLFINTFEDLSAFNDVSPATATASAGVALVDASTSPANLAGSGSGLRFYDHSVTVGVRALQDLALPMAFKLEIAFYNNNEDTVDTFHGPALRFGNTGAGLSSSTNATFYINFRKDSAIRAYYGANAFAEVRAAPGVAHVLTLYVNADPAASVTYEGPSATRTLAPMSYDAYVNDIRIGSTTSGMAFMNPSGYTQANGIGRFGFTTASTHTGADFSFDNLIISPIP